jgi:hypothetical protein
VVQNGDLETGRVLRGVAERGTCPLYRGEENAIHIIVNRTQTER